MHPIVVTLVVVAVTLAVILGFVSYVLSVWSVQQQHFMVRPLLYARGAELAVGEPVLVLYVANEGPRAVKIVRVEVLAGGGSYINSSVWVVEPGARREIVIEGWVRAGEPAPIEPGNVYRIYVYTDELGRLIYDAVVAG